MVLLSQTHLHSLTVKAALKHLSSSGVNYQHVLSSTPSIRVRKAPQNRKIRHYGMLLGDEAVFGDNDVHSSIILEAVMKQSFFI